MPLLGPWIKVVRAKVLIEGSVLEHVIDGREDRVGATTASLLALSEWLTETKCTHVAMEATGVYWKPVWHILSDGDLELVLANATHIKNVHQSRGVHRRQPSPCERRDRNSADVGLP